MRYPAIYQSTVNWNAILLFSDKQGVVLDKHETVISTSCGWIESAFKNITTEYLANTYGEVKSKEHAEFIVKLAEVNKVVVCDVYRDPHKFFAVIDSSLLFLNSGAIAMKDGRKQITIPLPPESNVNTPEEDFEMTQVAKNNGDNLIFGDADKCKEWPCVNDEVETDDGVGVVKLMQDVRGYYVVSVNGEYYQYQIDELSKPKTPEQELRDELISAMDNSNTAFQYAEYLAKYLLDQYTLTKKPQ